MSSHATSSVQRPAARATAPTEHTGLLHWGRVAQESHPQTPVEAPHPGFLDHLARFTHPAGAVRPAAEAHARHFWQIESPKPHTVRPYKPGTADAMRLDGITFSTEAVLLTYAAAGFIDALAPRGAAALAPDGGRHRFAAVACLLGAYLAYRSVAPAVAGHLYGAMLYGCGRVNDRMHDHPISTRLAGYAGSSILALGGAAGAVALHVHNSHNTDARLPEQGWDPSIYSSVSVLALAMSVPALAAVGWYVGRMGSAVCHKRSA